MQKACRSFSTNQLEPIFEYAQYAFAIKMFVVHSIQQDSEQDVDKIISLGILENEPIEDANRDMDLLAQQSFEDCD